MKASVAYEAPRRPKKPLKWHNAKGDSLEAKGTRGVYRVVRQKPNRRLGLFRWALFLDGNPIKSLDLREELKDFAAGYDFAMSPTPSPATGAAPGKNYIEKVKEALARMGSPTPDEDVAKSEGYLKGKEAAGVDPMIVAAVIEATLHHSHPHTGPKTTQFALEAAEEAGRLTQAERDSLPRNLFALPERRELLVDTPERTRNAPARLEMMHNRGDVTRAEYDHARHRILSASHHFGIESRYEAYEARESPTREEWEVIVADPPASHRGAILSRVGPGDSFEAGNKIILRGFHDDQEASNVASSIARQYRVGVTFGPRNKLYEAAERNPLV